MSIDKHGHFCLTTLEYVFQGTANSFSTQCPSCGLRLVIRYDNFVNRATSLGLIISISALIGYHIGANKHWIKQFARRILRFLNFNDKPGTSDASTNRLNMKNIFRNGQELTNASNDNASDSAIDFYWSDHEDFDEQVHEMMAYDKYYDDLFHCQNDQYPNYQNIHSKTVDKIDKVLHQIDDIKKSIVEIDDELYHVTGSKYASFNPDFLTLTDYGLEELDDNQYSSLRSNDNFVENQHRLSDDNHRHQMQQFVRKRHNSRNLSRSVDRFNDQQQQQQHYENRHRKLSSLSLGSIDSNLQLEWDESEYDFNFQCSNDMNSVQSRQSRENSPLVELSTTSITSAPFSSSEAVSNDSVKSPVETPMTDEQKLKSMQELLEEAKRLGLLNNIIDAFLNPSTTMAIRKTSRSSDNDEDEDI